jgi:hypothetical protein
VMNSGDMSLTSLRTIVTCMKTQRSETITCSETADTLSDHNAKENLTEVIGGWNRPTDRDLRVPSWSRGGGGQPSETTQVFMGFFVPHISCLGCYAQTRFNADKGRRVFNTDSGGQRSPSQSELPLPASDPLVSIRWDSERALGSVWMCFWFVNLFTTHLTTLSIFLIIYLEWQISSE